MEKYKILVLDGGGIRGLVTCMILAALEKRLRLKVGNPKIKLVEKLDLLSGTSIGGIISMLMLTTQNEVPKYDCQEILEIMIKEYSQIFTPNSNLWSFWGYDHPKYDSRNMEIVANKYALSTNLDQLYKDIIIPVYDLDKKSPRLITRKDKFFLKEISKGIISAPSYFVLSPSIDLNGNEHHFIDGGVVANCPAMLAVTHILEHSEGHVSASQFIIINIGTGKPKDNYPYTKIKDWGKLDWANNISTLLIDANSEIAVAQMSQLFHHNFIHLNPKLETASQELDCITASNIQNLQKDTQKYLELPETKKKLDQIIDYLVS